MWFRITHLVSVLLILSPLLLIWLMQRSDQPSINCSTINSGANNYNILIVGESWASDGKLFPELPLITSARLNGRGVMACSIGFSGRNSKLLYYELREKFSKEKIRNLFNNAAPNKLLVMTGVNDTIQHIGASNYVEYTKKIIEFFDNINDIEVITIPRVNERTFRSPNLFSAIKRSILRCLYDHCDYQVNDLYRVALWRDHPELRLIEYDDFIDEYRDHEYCHTQDGIHLTDEYYHKYGVFLAIAMNLEKKEMTKK